MTRVVELGRSVLWLPESFPVMETIRGTRVDLEMKVDIKKTDKESL